MSPELARDAESEPPHCAQDRQSRRPGLPGPVTSEHTAAASHLPGRRNARWETPTRKTLPASLGVFQGYGKCLLSFLLWEGSPMGYWAITGHVTMSLDPPPASWVSYPRLIVQKTSSSQSQCGQGSRRRPTLGPQCLSRRSPLAQVTAGLRFWVRYREGGLLSHSLDASSCTSPLPPSAGICMGLSPALGSLHTCATLILPSARAPQAARLTALPEPRQSRPPNPRDGCPAPSGLRPDLQAAPGVGGMPATLRSGTAGREEALLQTWLFLPGPPPCLLLPQKTNNPASRDARVGVRLITRPLPALTRPPSLQGSA